MRRSFSCDIFSDVIILLLVLLFVFPAAGCTQQGSTTTAGSPAASTGAPSPGITVSATPHGRPSDTPAPGRAQARTPRPGIGFATPGKLAQHYEKHGREFGNITVEEYLRLAQGLRDCEAEGTVLELVRQDGTVCRYDSGTGTFIAFRPDGIIRTCFKPHAGERYFYRQGTRSDAENPRKERQSHERK